VTNPLWVGGSLAVPAVAAWDGDISGVGTTSAGGYLSCIAFIWISIGGAIVSLRYRKWISNR
jgi:glutamate:GABA antiporter